MLKLIHQFLTDETGVAATEFAMILPALVAMFLGTIDVGRGILIGRKMITANQTVADILSREEAISNAEINDAIAGARMILAPFPTTGLGHDLIGIQFSGTGNSPQIMWRVTDNMPPNAIFPDVAIGLGAGGEGVLAVNLRYTYTPVFYGFVLGPVTFSEVAILRGRKNTYIPRE